MRLGLINNMPDAARRATERQFTDLVVEAVAPQSLDLVRLHLPSLGRPLDMTSQPAEALAELDLDLLIVTGAEPRAENLRDEAYWGDFAHAVDLATDAGLPVLYSCLAAHAAVQHLFGVTRRRLRRKLSGVFQFPVLADHPWAVSLPDRLMAPHSRWNALPVDALKRVGASVLSQAPTGGVDAFTFGSLPGALFLQGHPEYGADTLLREYKRDLSRHLTDPALPAPTLPKHLLSAKASAALAGRLEVCEAALRASMPIAPWRASAVALFRRWLMPLTSPRRAHVADRLPMLDASPG